MSWPQGCSVQSDIYSAVQCNRQDYWSLILSMIVCALLMFFAVVESAEGAASDSAAELWKLTAGWVRPNRCYLCYPACLTLSKTVRGSKVPFFFRTRSQNFVEMYNWNSSSLLLTICFISLYFSIVLMILVSPSSCTRNLFLPTSANVGAHLTWPACRCPKAFCCF